MKQGALETVVGLAVVLIAVFFFIYAYNENNNKRGESGYVLNADFQNIEGLDVGSEVKISGIKVGRVQDIQLDGENFFAKVSLSIRNGVEVPSDSRAIVATSGFLGGKHIRINPGASEKLLSPGGKIVLTQDAINLEDLISKLLYSVTSK